MTLTAPVIEPWHGTTNGYRRHGCRCDPCREAESIYQRERYAARKARAEEAPREEATRLQGICDCGLPLPHRGRCGPPPVPIQQPFLW